MNFLFDLTVRIRMEILFNSVYLIQILINLFYLNYMESFDFDLVLYYFDNYIMLYIVKDINFIDNKNNFMVSCCHFDSYNMDTHNYS